MHMTEETVAAVRRRTPPEVLEALNILASRVWHLLEAHRLMPEGSYTFPDGDTWTEEELQQWKASGYQLR